MAIVRARSLAVQTDELFNDLRTMPRDTNPKTTKTYYSLHIDLDELTGKRKAIKVIDVKAGEGEEVAALVQSLSGEKPAIAGDTPTIKDAIAEVLASDLKGRTKKEYGRFFADFAKFFGEHTRFGAIDQREFARFAATVKAHPNWADKTKNLRIVAAARLFNFYEETNPSVPRITTKNLKNKRARPAGQDREAFTVDDMRAIFANAAKYRDKNPAKWWITVAPAFLGCRVEELAQAHLMGDFVRDVATNALVLNITEAIAEPNEDDPDDAATAKSVKTFAGWRKVPVHPALIDAGFLAFLQLRGEKLKLVEHIATGMEIPPARALTMIVDLGLGEMWFAVQQMRELIDSGATPEEASKPIVRVLTQERGVKRRARLARTPRLSGHENGRTWFEKLPSSAGSGVQKSPSDTPTGGVGRNHGRLRPGW